MNKKIEFSNLYYCDGKVFCLGSDGPKSFHDPIFGLEHLIGTPSWLKRNFMEYLFENTDLKPIHYDFNILLEKGQRKEKNAEPSFEYNETTLIQGTMYTNKKDNSNKEDDDASTNRKKASAIRVGFFKPLHPYLVETKNYEGIHRGRTSDGLNVSKDGVVYKSPDELIKAGGYTADEAFDVFENTSKQNLIAEKIASTGYYQAKFELLLDEVSAPYIKDLNLNERERSEYITKSGGFIKNGRLVLSREHATKRFSQMIDMFYGWEPTSNMTEHAAPIELVRTTFGFGNKSALVNDLTKAVAYDKKVKIFTYDKTIGDQPTTGAYAFNGNGIYNLFDKLEDRNNLNEPMPSSVVIEKAKEQLMKMWEEFADEFYATIGKE